LKSQESDLHIGLGNTEDVILKLVNEVTMQGLCWELCLQIYMHVQLLPSNTFRSPGCMHCWSNRYKRVLFLQKRRLTTEHAVFWPMLNHLCPVEHSHGAIPPR
jgi:hypothetical protein